MDKTQHKDAEEARDQFLELVEAAAKSGRSTVITKHGRPVAALVPIESSESLTHQKSILSLVGSGRGLWGKKTGRTLRALRKEWDR